MVSSSSSMFFVFLNGKSDHDLGIFAVHPAPGEGNDALVYSDAESEAFKRCLKLDHLIAIHESIRMVIGTPGVHIYFSYLFINGMKTTRWTIRYQSYNH